MVFTFSLDKYLNEIIPPSQIHKLPPYLARWLGQPHKLSRKPKPDYILWLDILISTYIGILTLEGIFRSSTVFKNHGAPILIASYGAISILLFNVNQVPLAQPRNVFFGQFFSALVGVIVLKLFELTETGKDHLWVGSGLAAAIASVVMTLLDCVHPPSGATALIPFLHEDIAKMGWWYIPTHVVSSAVLIGIALITNNILRSYPVYWWTPYTKTVVVDLEKDGNEVEGIRRVDSENVHILIKKSRRVVIDMDQIEICKGLELTAVEYLALDTIKMKLQYLEEPDIE